MLLPALLLALAACNDEIAGLVQTDGLPIELYGEIDQEYVTRATDDGFAGGDRMGVYIVDYANNQPGKLAMSGNRANNALFEYDATSMKWSCGTQFYFRDPKTAVDVYGYYPYTSSVNSVDEWLFTVDEDQSAEGKYENSDLLWAKASGIKPSTDVIKLTYTHRMAGVMVTLQKGDGISDTEWGKVSKSVTVDNTRRMGAVDLATGTVTATGNVDKGIVMCPQGDDVWRAVVIPQAIQTGTRLFGITIDGTSYNYTRAQDLALMAGKLHRFTLKIDKKEGGDYSLSLVSEEITPWENDKVTHGFFTYEYTVVTTTEPGTLKATIEAMGKDYAKIKNLKIIGPITDSDFQFMREEMSELAMLNMKEARSIFHNEYDGWNEKNGQWQHFVIDEDNVIPTRALRDKRSLRRLILPDKLKCIKTEAFASIGLDENSTLIFPPGLKTVEGGAFRSIGEAGTLVLNDSIEVLGGWYDTYFTCDGNIPKSLKAIGSHTFSNMHIKGGHYCLPEDLKSIEGGWPGSFGGALYDEVGEIIVPKFITTIEHNMFPKFTRGCYITFHDGVEKILGLGGQRFINHVRVPEGVTYLGGESFFCTQFNAGVSLPSTLRYMGGGAFAETIGMGDLVIPEGISSIPTRCFDRSDMSSCILPKSCIAIEENAFVGSALKSIKIDKYCTMLGKRAFADCRTLRTIVCLAPEPPAITDTGDWEHPFAGCNMNMLVLEVPENSVELYRNAPGWNKIHFISAYHELAVGVSELKCLDGGMTRETLVRAEGAWEVAECPDWCKVNPMSSEDRRTEVTITVAPTTQGTARNGKIIFKLKNAEYSTYTTVSQLAYEHPQDKDIVLKESSIGDNKIPVLLVGDGFDAYNIANGKYMEAMTKACEHLFSIEPFKTYQDYFNVTTLVAVSPDEDIEIDDKQTRFHFNITPFGPEIDFNAVRDYALDNSANINSSNIDNALVIVVPKFDAFLGLTHIEDNGMSMACCTYSSDTYPYDYRGLIQHYGWGRAWGRLAYETISHNEFIRGCEIPCCNALSELKKGQAKGWYQNVSLTGGLNSVPWRHLVFDPRYSDIVDAYEGGWNHLRGVYRSENMSVMSSYVQYFSTWQRELLVRRIMELAGKPFNFDEFVSKDSREGRPE